MEWKTKELIADRLLRQELIKSIKILTANIHALLIYQNYAIAVCRNEENSLKVMKITLNEIKEVELAQFKTKQDILACLLLDSTIVYVKIPIVCFYIHLLGNLELKLELALLRSLALQGLQF